MRFFKSQFQENISWGRPPSRVRNKSLQKLSRIFPRTPIAAYIWLPIGSMYAIDGDIYHQYTPNVSIYTIHGSSGLYNIIYIQYNICTHVEFWYETRGTGSSNSQDAATATVAGRTSLSMVCIMDRNSMNFWVMLSYLFIHSEIRCTENSKRWLIPQGKNPEFPVVIRPPNKTAVQQNRYSLNAALNMVQEERARRWFPPPKKWLATTRRNHGGYWWIFGG